MCAQENQLAVLTYNSANGTDGICPVTDDSQKYDLSAHCNGACSAALLDDGCSRA